MTFLRSHISIFILLLFILCSNYIFGQDLKGNNVILPATNSTVGSIKIGSWNALNMYGVKNIYVGNSGNFNSPASDSNVAIGYGALRVINNASRNVAVGPYAGGRIVNADGNVWIGNEAGNDSTFRNIDNIGGIDNSDTICPLIYFDFENNQVRICGTLDVNNGITGIDSVLWYLNGDTIINKSRHLVTIDSGLFLPHPQSNTRLGYVLAWEHTNGRVFPVEISQLSDTATAVGIGYWTLDSLNGVIRLNDTTWYTRIATLGVDEINSFTPDLDVHHEINCDTVFVDTTQGFYDFSYLNQSVSITGNEFNYDIEIGDRIYIYFHCVSSMPGCDTNFYLTPRVYFDVDSIDYNETFDSVTYIGDGMNYSPCQSDMCSYDQELVYKMGYIKCDDSVATTTYPVIVNDQAEFTDSVLFQKNIKIYPLPEEATKVGRIMTLLSDGNVEWASPNTLMDTLPIQNIWYLNESLDTTKTNYHVKVDSSFLMKYSNYKFGFNKLSTTMFFVGNQFINDSQHLFNGIIEGVPIPGLGTNPYLALIADDIRDGYGGSAIFIGNTSNFPYYVHELDGIDHTTGIGINDNSYEIFIGDNNEGQAAIFRIDTTSALFKTNFINNVGGFEIHHDTTIFDGIIKTNILPELSSDYLVGWNSLTKQLVATDSSGVVFHSEIGFYQEELSTTKTIFNLGFTITNNALVSLNGTIINPSQWTGIGTSTLTLLLDTQQYDLFTIKQ